MKTLRCFFGWLTLFAVGYLLAVKVCPALFAHGSSAAFEIALALWVLWIFLVLYLLICTFNREPRA